MTKINFPYQADPWLNEAVFFTQLLCFWQLFHLLYFTLFVFVFLWLEFNKNLHQLAAGLHFVQSCLAAWGVGVAVKKG